MAEKGCARTWAEINLDNIGHNAKVIRSMVCKDTEIMGVVKADAYGHGVLEVANTLIRNGVTRLAVSMLDEAVQLRRMGITVPVLVLSDPEPDRTDELLKYDITQTVISEESGRELSENALKLKGKVKVHIAVDTGMGRVGFYGDGAVSAIERIYGLEGLSCEGIFTHFSLSDGEDENYTFRQFELFKKIIGELEDKGIYFKIKHCANSAALMRYPFMHLDVVRAGIILYGLSPSFATDKLCKDLLPAMSVKAVITMVKKLPAGSYISYGCTYKTEKDTYVATVPIGYADGYLRSLGGRAFVSVRGHRAKIIGRICMDQCMADVTEVFEKGEKVEAGDVALIFGEDEYCKIRPEEIADPDCTINYELVSLVGKRVPRIYIKNGRVVNVLNYLLE